ncbi:hypothetical protein M8J75_005937 [Diaphorina citri]|nr:hypothetical protein M8J75_005937 [Diaphorina citri]
MRPVNLKHLMHNLAFHASSYTIECKVAIREVITCQRIENQRLYLSHIYHNALLYDELTSFCQGRGF